ncbi:Hypothetical predicted protein, partial [Mytilus galloprovincialis]
EYVEAVGTNIQKKFKSKAFLIHLVVIMVNEEQDHKENFEEEPGCTKEFLTGRGLEQHILTGKHDFIKRPATDSVKQMMWIDKCNSLNANFFSVNSEFKNNANEYLINKGWGLKRPNK